MLHIHMPEHVRKKQARRRRRALLYIASGLIILTCYFLSVPHFVPCFLASAAVGAWWAWAVLTDPGLE